MLYNLTYTQIYRKKNVQYATKGAKINIPFNLQKLSYLLSKIQIFELYFQQNVLEKLNYVTR